MIAITPNLRNIKPLSKYMALRIRMYGRQRFARTFSQSGSNMSLITLPFVPNSAELLEVYHDGIRMVDGYTVSGQKVTFTKPILGKLEFIDDDQFVDMSEKWLTIPATNLLHYDNTDQSAYGTDRRDGQKVAVHAKPICITQGAIGFCRPSHDGESLLYCSYYGMYGRDSVTYAIRTDLGQLSDYRCIDIRVRDPNYIPTMRLACISAQSSPIKANGEVKDITGTGGYQLYGAISKDQTIQLPNRTAESELKEYHFVIQGSDENGDWFEPEEYFEPDTYRVRLTGSEGFTITYQGSGKDYGYENAFMFSVMCARDPGDSLSVVFEYDGQQLFFGRIEMAAAKPVNSLDKTIVQSSIVLDNGGATEAKWTYGEEWLNFRGIWLDTVWENPVEETRNVQVTMDFEYSIDAYDPIAQKQGIALPQTKTVTGSFKTSFVESENIVTQPENTNDILLENVFYWETSDPFSAVLTGNVEYISNYVWTITPTPPPEEIPEENPETGIEGP